MNNIYLMNVYLTKLFRLKTNRARKNYLSKILKNLDNHDALLLLDISKDLIK